MYRKNMQGKPYKKFADCPLETPTLQRLWEYRQVDVLSNPEAEIWSLAPLKATTGIRDKILSPPNL